MADWVLPEIQHERCTRCGACVRRCPTGALEMRDTGPVIAHPEACTYCAFCESLCPENAIRCSFEIVWGARARSAGSVRDRPELEKGDRPELEKVDRIEISREESDQTPGT